jgi:hypothetical protein
VKLSQKTTTATMKEVRWQGCRATVVMDGNVFLFVVVVLRTRQGFVLLGHATRSIQKTRSGLIRDRIFWPINTRDIQSLNRLGWLESDDDKTSQKDPVRIEKHREEKPISAQLSNLPR